MGRIGAGIDGRTLRGLAATLALGYLLVLQSLLGGLATGSHAGMSVALGPNGEVICLNAPADGDSRSDPASHQPDCCTSGCRVAAVASLPPPDATPLAVPVTFASLAPLLPGASAATDGIGHRPHNARAPPVA